MPLQWKDLRHNQVRGSSANPTQKVKQHKLPESGDPLRIVGCVAPRATHPTLINLPIKHFTN